MWVDILSWFNFIVLFLSLNVVIGTIIATSKMHQNNNNGDLGRSPYLLYKVSTFNFSRDKVENVAKSKTMKKKRK
jgi:hypothetical protein